MSQTGSLPLCEDAGDIMKAGDMADFEKIQADLGALQRDVAMLLAHYRNLETEREKRWNEVREEVKGATRETFSTLEQKIDAFTTIMAEAAEANRHLVSEQNANLREGVAELRGARSDFAAEVKAFRGELRQSRMEFDSDTRSLRHELSIELDRSENNLRSSFGFRLSLLGLFLIIVIPLMMLLLERYAPLLPFGVG